MLSDEFFIVDTANVSWEQVDGEVIAIQLSTGRYYNMVDTATAIWLFLSNGASIDTLATKLRQLYKDESLLLSGLEDFVSECIESSLLVPIDKEKLSREELFLDLKFDEWSAPRLNEYIDLQDLILVDPIHDVQESGWPNLDK
ncbi:MAG: hypothetical protein RL733_896 [Actinomycetota bacterium]|jgi:hypothetical protein